MTHQIVSYIINRNEKGMHLLYKYYGDILYGLSIRILCDAQLAEDALQTSMLKIWQNINKFDSTRSTFFTWISIIVRNTAIDQKRLKSFNTIQKTHQFSEFISTSYVISPNGSKIDAAKLLAHLKEPYRVVLELAYLQGNTQQEISDCLGIPLGTVKTRLRKAIGDLRNLLKNERSYFWGAAQLYGS